MKDGNLQSIQDLTGNTEEIKLYRASRGSPEDPDWGGRSVWEPPIFDYSDLIGELCLEI